MNLAAVGIGGGIIAAGWEHLRSMVSYLRNLVVITASVECDYGDFVFKLCKKIMEGKRYFRLGGKYLCLCRWTNKDGSSSQNVVCEQNIYGNIFWLYRWLCPVVLSIQDSKVSFTYVRWLFNPHSFFKECMAVEEKNNEENRWYISHRWGNDYSKEGPVKSKNEDEPICSSTGSSYWSNGFRSNYYGINNIIHCENRNSLGFVEKNGFSSPSHYETKAEESLYKDIEFWLESKNWYEKTCIQWKRGALLYGEPGTGKTSMVYNISRRLDIPVRVFHLENFDNKLFLETWHGDSDGIICLIEDFDAVFDGREFRCKTQTNIGMTFDSFLNTIDGVDHRNGIFMVITTNYPEKLDKALVDYRGEDSIILRPGRIDHVIKCERIGREGVEFLAKNILYDWDECERKTFVDNLGHLFPVTAAQAQELCMSAAIEHRWLRRKHDIHGREDGRI
jgi:hypothetical protein